MRPFNFPIFAVALAVLTCVVGGEHARAEYDGWHRVRSAAFAAGCLPLLFVVLFRQARMTTAAGELFDFVSTLPVQIAGHLAWILGESRGYAAHALRRSLSRSPSLTPQVTVDQDTM